MSWEFEKIASGFGLTEGPVWDGDGLIFSDYPNDRILRIDHNTCEWTTIRTETDGANGLKHGPDGDLYACEGRGRRVVRYDEDGSVTVVAAEYEGKRLNAPNDLAIDSDGRIWFTDPNYPVHNDGFDFDYGAVYRADPVGDDEWKLTQVINDTDKPNGILLSPDKSTLYVAETHHEWGKGDRELRAYTVREDCSIGDYAVLHNFFPHRSIDGMCLTVEGNLVATAGSENKGPGPMIYVFAPNGRVLETHPFPADNPTNCAFGGPGLQTLYATNFELPDDEERFDAATASLHRAKTDRKGSPIH
jgi:gluconolactonase